MIILTSWYPSGLRRSTSSPRLILAYAFIRKVFIFNSILISVEKAGDPKSRLPLHFVSSGKAARLILNKWKRQYDRTADFIVIEGYKAGGHLGFKKDELLENTCASLKDILKDVKEVVKGFEELFNHAIPVFVAGGIYTNDDIKEMLEAGADGVQMGTRFIGTYELFSATPAILSFEF